MGLAVALDLMRRASEQRNDDDAFRGSEDAQPFGLSPCTGLLGSYVGSYSHSHSLSLSLYFSLFGGRLMKYPCQFNRVTSAVPSHPKSSDDPRAGALLSLQARRNILSANKPSPFVASPLGSSGPSYPLRTPFAAAFSIVPAFCKSPEWLNSFA